MQVEIGKRSALIFLEGVIYDAPSDDRWIKRRKKLFNQDVPTDEDEQRLFYINNELLKTPADRENITKEIYMLSMTGADEEVISAMETLFQRQVEIAQRPIIKNLKALTEEKTESVALHPDAEGRNNGKSVGANPRRVPKKKVKRSS